MTNGFSSTVPRTIHTLRLELQEVEPSIWRTLEVDGSIRLDEFHEILQVVMGWTNSHLHGYSSAPPLERVGPNAPPITEWLMEPSLIEQEGDGIDETEATVSSALADTGGRLWYSYDFGDNWLHLITGLSSRPAEEHDPVARILSGDNAAPPEDCGGSGGFARLSGMLAGPDTAEREDIEGWIRASRSAWNPYRPGECDVAAGNREMAYITSIEGIGDDTKNPAEGKLNRLGAFVFTRTEDGEPEGVRVFLAARLAAAGIDPLALPAATEAPAGVEAMMTRYQWIIREALDGGIKLTAAGWMPPAVVKKAHAEVDFGRERDFGEPAASESQDLLVADLRATAVDLGLLKVEGKKVITATAAGQRLVDDPAGLWKHIIPRVFEPRLAGADYDATVLMLMAAALGIEPEPDIPRGDAVVQGMNWLDYRHDNREITERWRLRTSERLGGVMEMLGIGDRLGFNDPETGKHFARAVLLT